MTDVWVSLSVLAAAVLLSEATRRITSRLFARASWLYLLEAASTFQLCCCSQELKLLAEKANLEPQPLIGLTLTYTITVVHLTTFRGAACNPVGVLDRVYRGIISGRAAVILIACQFAAAVASQFFAASVWSLGLSDVHVRHQKFGFRCFDPVGGTLLEAVAAEMVGAFILQAVVLNLHKVDAKLRVFCIATLITTLVYVVGGISGAVLNPVLAFALQFPCSGHTYLEYCFVYWLGPASGVASCVLFMDRILPFLSGKSSVGQDAATAELKSKMQ